MLEYFVSNVLITPAYLISLAVGAAVSLLIADRKIMAALPLFGAYVFSSAVIGFGISRGGLFVNL